MRPYGERKKLKHNFKNNKLPKGHINWWEEELYNVCKKRARREAKKEIEKEILKDKEVGDGMSA